MGEEANRYKAPLAVLERPLNSSLVSSYLLTQHGHLSAVRDLIFDLNISHKEKFLISMETFCQSCEVL